MFSAHFSSLLPRAFDYACGRRSLLPSAAQPGGLCELQVG